MVSHLKSSEQNSNENQKTIQTDIDLIDYNLSLTVEERLLNHQRALNTVNELLKARKQIYGEPEPSSETPT